MRCEYCGYVTDQPNQSSCPACGQPFYQNSASGAQQNNYGDSNGYRPLGAQQFAQDDEIARATRVVRPDDLEQMGAGQPFYGGNDAQQDMRATQRQRECPQCHYILLDDMPYCPSCGYDTRVPDNKPKSQPAKAVSAPEISIPETVTCDKCGKEVSTEFSFCPYCSAKIRLKTLSVWGKDSVIAPPEPEPEPEPDPRCSLTVIPNDGESLSIVPNEYEGKSISLVRDNTEPSNRTITSKGQAMLEYVDGKWLLTDQSENGTTMVQASRPLEVETGDVIVMGNRRFRFEAVQPEKE